MNLPPHLDDAAHAKWQELAPILAARGDADQGTADALAGYCVAWSQWTAAETKVRELGAVVKSPAGFPVENPYLTVARKSQAEMRRWASELKLTPKARGKRPVVRPLTLTTLPGRPRLAQP